MSGFGEREMEAEQKLLEKMDKEEAKAKQKGIRKWGWLIWGISITMVGFLLLWAFFNWYKMGEFLLFGFVCIVTGIICLIYREIDFPIF